jgi:NADH-quinone oxidoreductase subunit L
MFIGLGTGSIAAGLFHLTTHAFFKSLLFLGAGSLIHALHTQDMREMGAMAKKMPWTTVTFSIGALALSGIVPFSGFFSKDFILDSLMHHHHYGYYAIALFSALLTAFYMTRLWIRVFSGKPRSAHYDHAHESDAKMLVPMGALAALTVVTGFGIVSIGEFLGSEAEFPQVVMAAFSTATALAGIGIGWMLFGGGRDLERLRSRHSLIYQIVSNKYYLDHVVDRTAADYTRFSEGVNWFDKVVINGVVNGVAVLCRWSGKQFKAMQTGKLQTYQRLAVAGALLIVIVAMLMKGA